MSDGVEPSRNGASRGGAQNGSHGRSGTGHAGRHSNSGNASGHPHLNPNLTNAHNGLMSGAPEGSLSMMGNAPPASGFGPGTPAGVSMAYSSHPHPTTQPPPHPDYGSSWRNPMAAALAGSAGGAGGSAGGQPQPGMAATAEAFSNYYFSGGYSPFSGDIRDSIAAIWSRTSPSGEGVAAAYSSGYGPFPDTSTGQFAANATPTGQFAANLTGHYAPGSEMGMFGTGPDYPPAAYGQPQFNYGQQYSQWPESAGLPNSSASGAIGSGNNGGMGVRNGLTNPGGGSSYGIGYGGEGATREPSMRHSRERGTDLSHGMGTLKLTTSSRRGTDMNGHSEAGTSHSKKMSWASVASQPAKPQSIAPKTKKPGVLPPPTLIPSASKTLPVEVSNSSLPRDPSPPLDNISVVPLSEPEIDRPESLPSTKRESRQPNQPLHLQPQPDHPQEHYQPRNQQQYQPSQQHQSQQQQQQPHQLLSHHQHHQQHYHHQQQAHPPHDPPGHRSGHQGRNTGSQSPTMRKSLGHNGDGRRMSERHPITHSSSRDMHDPPRGGYADKSGSNSGPRNQRQYSNANGSSGSSHEYRSGNGRSGHHGDFNSGEKKRTDRVADFGGGIAPSSGSHGSPPSLQATHHPILESLQSQNEYNPKTFDLNPKNAKFFVIKSFSEDDIHRSIKYEIWCSTDHGNKRLDAGFKERNGKGPVFLLFSVNGSGHFCGMAEMLSGVDYNATGSVWVQDKFKGQFKVKWIYVKDVPNGQLRHIRLENNENKPVTNSRDTQEVPPDKGKQVLKIIHTYKHQTSIFDDFIHYEKRQEEEEGKKSMSAAPLSSHSAHNKDAGNGGNHHSLQHPSRGGSSGGAAGGAGKDGQDTHQGGGPSAQGGGRGSRGGGERVGKFNNHHPNNHFNSNTKNTNNMGSKTPNTSGQGASNRR